MVVDGGIQALEGQILAVVAVLQVAEAVLQVVGGTVAGGQLHHLQAVQVVVVPAVAALEEDKNNNLFLFTLC